MATTLEKDIYKTATEGLQALPVPICLYVHVFFLKNY
jgi:hypothetical protein